eukprot:comp14447_c0_seq1/m.20851 comp14447_c0_seq1/g.20851  ORF comp14447_c0_seq1/g.20851 comp14447_c0_seq1/m.20851 type:complete len:130 (-) comp14447_c0_seq1:18-407(-)
MALLRPKALQNALDQSLSHGTFSSLIVGLDGAVVSAVGQKDQSSVVGSLVAHIWSSFSLVNSSDVDEPRIVFVRNTKNSIAVTKCADLLIVLISEIDAAEGLVRKKLDVLASNLADPLSKLAVENSAQY